MSDRIEAMMVTARRLLYAGAALAILAACRVSQTTQPLSAASAGPSVQGTTAESWHLSFHFSGGFAGVDRELELASTGELTARDRKRGTHVTAQAPANDLAQIAALVADVKSVDSGRPTACRDCLQYDLEVQVRGQALVVHLHDMTLASSGTEPLVKALTSLLDRALADRLNSRPPDIPP